MTDTADLMARNTHFAATFDAGDLPILPRYRAVILACVDARVDPAHILNLSLGDAVVMRNSGGRVTPEVIDEVAALAFMVAAMEGGNPGPFELVLMQHTQCGAERFADPQLQAALRSKGVDVAHLAISDHAQSLKDDLAQLRAASVLPDHLVVSGYLYDVRTGAVTEVVPPARLR